MEVIFFSDLSGLLVGLCDRKKNYSKRDNDCLCTLLHVCACRKETNTHTPSKPRSSFPWLRWSVSPPHSTVCLSPPLALSFLFLPAAKGKETRSCISSPSSTLPLWASIQCCSGARGEEMTEQRQMSRQWELSCVLEEWPRCLGLSAWKCWTTALGKTIVLLSKIEFWLFSLEDLINSCLKLILNIYFFKDVFWGKATSGRGTAFPREAEKQILREKLRSCERCR